MLRDAIAFMDSPDYQPASNPILQLDLTVEKSNEDNLAPVDAHAWPAGIADVGNLLVTFASRVQEQIALLSTTHTSTVLKHQVEARRLQEKLIQEQKAALTANEALTNARAENALLQEQLRQESLSSVSKIDILHQKIAYLESSLHKEQEKAKQMSSPLSSSTPPSIPENPTGTNSNTMGSSNYDTKPANNASQSSEEPKASDIEKYVLDLLSRLLNFCLTFFLQRLGDGNRTDAS